MPVIYPTNVKSARMTAVRDLADAGAGPATLQIGTTAMGTVLATIVLADPCGTVSGTVLTLSGFPRSDTSADATGTAAAARVRDSTGADVITGLSVGTSGSDINVDSVIITAGQTVTINAATVTHAA